jgi:hypothetical protein
MNPSPDPQGEATTATCAIPAVRDGQLQTLIATCAHAQPH